MEDLIVAAVAMRSAVGKKAENLARMETMADQAARKGARIVCFPELNISGYGLREKKECLAETIPGPLPTLF